MRVSLPHAKKQLNEEDTVSKIRPLFHAAAAFPTIDRAAPPSVVKARAYNTYLHSSDKYFRIAGLKN